MPVSRGWETVMASAEVYYVYRTVLPHQFEKREGKPRPTAFHLRANETALSVWDAATVTPGRLFQNYLDEVNAELQSNDEERQRKAHNRLIANGETPEEMYDKGWRVVRLSEDEFTALELPVEPPRADGHRDVIGAREDFEDSAFALCAAAQTLTRDETLA